MPGYSLRRIPAYVQGLDEVLGGGIIEESILLIAGESGTGKTVLASQIAYFNALNGRKVIYVSFDEGTKLKDYLKGFGWDLDKLISEEKFKLLD
ncbi:MAG: KaiC domain-containing protein, partial [Thermoprotei archaeon]